MPVKSNSPTPRILVCVSIFVVIALIHAFRLGQVFDGELYKLYYAYFSDIILPFGLYFLLALNDASIPVLRPWYVKAGIIFSLRVYLNPRGQVADSLL